MELTMVKAQAYLKAGKQGEIARTRQPLIIKKRGSYATISGELTT